MKLSLLRLAACVSAVLLSATSGFAQGTALTEPLVALAKPTEGIVGLSSDGALLRSTDSGVSFLETRAADPHPFLPLKTLAAKDSIVVAMGNASDFVRSTNNGATWSGLQSAISDYVGTINAVAPHGDTWIAVGKRGTNISALRSTDGGSSWDVATIPVASGELRGVAWTGSRWLAVGGDSGSGFIYTSNDGSSWSLLTNASDELNAIATNGADKVLVVGGGVSSDGLMLYADDVAASFDPVGVGTISEALRAVVFTAGDNWIIGGDNGAVLSFNGEAETTDVVFPPTTETTAAVTALLSTGTGSGYYYFSESAAPPPAEHGPISLQVALVSGQLQLTLVGAETGNSYHIESSPTLASFTAVAASTQAYSGGSAPTWTFPVPAAGGRVFYRAVIGVEP